MKVYSIFLSIDGEQSIFGQGVFTTFIRLAGCNLNCSWNYGKIKCDTEYARDVNSGREMSVEQIFYEVQKLSTCGKITITGGEPLLQRKELKQLVQLFKGEGYSISIETNGSIFVPTNFEVDCWVVDWKLDSSGMSDKMNIDYFLLLSAKDYIKFVIACHSDYIQALNIIAELDEWDCRANYLMSPIIGVQDINELVGWIKRDECFKVQLSVQLHKLVNLNEKEK